MRATRRTFGLFAAETGAGLLPPALGAPEVARIHPVDLAALLHVVAGSPRRGRHLAGGPCHVLLVARLQRPRGQFDVLDGRTLKQKPTRIPLESVRDLVERRRNARSLDNEAENDASLSPRRRIKIQKGTSERRFFFIN